MKIEKWENKETKKEKKNKTKQKQRASFSTKARN